MCDHGLEMAAISPSHSDLIDQKLQIVVHSDKSTKLKPSGYLYHDKGVGSIFSSDIYREKYGLGTKSNDTLLIATNNPTKDKNVKAETWISSTVQIMQGLKLNTLKLLKGPSWKKEAYTSIPVLVHLMQENGPFDYRN